jgi:LemA protein
MEVIGWVILGRVIATFLYGVVIYNRLVPRQHNVSKAWANIAALLSQRHDELPKLVEACTHDMADDPETRERVMRARQDVSERLAAEDVPGLGATEQQRRGWLGQLVARAEADPDLKADHTFRHRQQHITGLGDAIADRRALYNEAVNRNNVGIEPFPDRLIAQRFGVSPAERLRFSDEETPDGEVPSRPEPVHSLTAHGRR